MPDIWVHLNSQKIMKKGQKVKNEPKDKIEVQVAYKSCSKYTTCIYLA